MFAADDDREAFLACVEASIRNLRTDDFGPLEQVWHDARTPIGRLYASLFCTSLATLRGDYDTAGRHLVRLRQASGRGEMQLYAMYATWFANVVDIARAQPDAATIRSRKDELIGAEIERLGVRTFTGPARAILANLFLLANAPEDALEAVEESLASPGTRYADVFAWRTRAVALGMLDRRDDAAMASIEAQRLAVQQGLLD